MTLRRIITIINKQNDEETISGNNHNRVLGGLQLCASGEPCTATDYLLGTEESIKNNNDSNPHYILANGSKGIGFYRTTAGEVGPFRAYMPVSDGTLVKGFRLSLDEVETAIRSVEDDSIKEGVVYNLGGQRVQKAAGLVIVNGKKIMVK